MVSSTVGRLAFWAVGVLGGWRFGRLAFWAVGVLGGWRFGRLAFWAVGGLCGWRFARLVVCADRGRCNWRFTRLAVCAVCASGGWRFGRLAVWGVGGLGGWRFGRLAVWAVGGLGGWRFGRLAVWAVGGLGGWQLMVADFAVCVWRFAFGGLRLAVGVCGLRLAVCVWQFLFGGLRLPVCVWLTEGCWEIRQTLFVRIVFFYWKTSWDCLVWGCVSLSGPDIGASWDAPKRLQRFWWNFDGIGSRAWSTLWDGWLPPENLVEKNIGEKLFPHVKPMGNLGYFQKWFSRNPL